MKDEEIEVGKEYVNILKKERYTLAYKAKNSVLLELEGRAVLVNDEHFKRHYSPAPVEREKVELFQTCSRNGDIRLCDSIGRYFDQTYNKWYAGSVYKRNRSKPPVAYLYTDDFSIEWIVDKE